MRAATFQGVRRVKVSDKPAPAVVESTDVVVEVELAGLCGSDLHPYRGHEVGIEPGTTMGHEFTGRVVEVGEEVRRFRTGDLVISPFTTSCGECGPCRRGLSSRCERGSLYGWVEHGAGLEGAQAQYVRVPLADSTLLARDPALSALEGLLLGDVISTGFHVVRQGEVQPDTPVAVLGLGAVGLAAVLACHQRGAPAVIGLDAVPERLALAERLGASVIPVTDGSGEPRATGDIAREVRALAGPEGVGVAIDAVGSPHVTELAVALLRPGGVLSIAGVHTEDTFALSPAAAYDKNLTLTIGRCPVRSHLEELCRMQLAERLPIEQIVSHWIPLADAADAYRMFDQRRNGCVKVVFEP